MTRPLHPVTIPRSHGWEVPRPEGPLWASLAWPAGPPPATGFPVLCVLDADTLFGTAVETARMQGGRPAATGVEPLAVLGIGHGPVADRAAARQRDYANGAADLLRLIEDRVLPAAADLVPLHRGRLALFGHSLAGLVPLQALLGGASPFSRFVSASPSLWWDGEALLRRAAGLVAAPAFAPSPLLLTVGGNERAPARPTAEPGRAERMAARRMVENVHALAAVLAPALPVRVIEFPGENHASVLPAALARAAAFACGDGDCGA